MATDADLSDFKGMRCNDESKGWPRSSSEVPDNLIDEYMDHAEKCPYHAELMLLEQRQTERELRMKFRLARGIDRQGRLLQGKMLTRAIDENERRLASWKKEREAANSPFNLIALYNGSRQIASCGSFFDFSRHESINELDPQAGLQIRGINRSEEEDVLLGSYALAGVRHDGEEQLLALRNGYTVGLRVIRLDAKTFALGFRCVDSASMEKLSYTQDFTTGGGEVSDRVLDSENPSFSKSKRLASTLLLVLLLFEAVSYSRQLRSMSNETALEAQSIFLYSDSDLVQMLTVEKLIAGSSNFGGTIHVVANNQKKRMSKRQSKYTTRDQLRNK